MAIFAKRGFKAVDKEIERQEQAKQQGGNKIFRFFLLDNKDSAEISFLTEEPINFYEHSVKGYRNGKETYDNVPCIGANCPHCANGLRASFKSAWLIVDHRERTYKDKDGKEQTVKDSVRLYVVGTKTAGMIQRKAQRYGLTTWRYLIERVGSGTSTTYIIENEDKVTLTPQEIEELLPEFLKEQYDGTMESLYTIIEKEIERLAPTGHEDEDEEEYDEELVSSEEDEEEEEEVAPRPLKKTLPKKTLGRKENSVKGIGLSRLKRR